ncbi:MAG: ester cyclase [Chloroflexi bacterium]|nr:ester cyclase [Chloroflexota bacterium]
MMPESANEIVSNLIQAYNAHDLDRAARHYTADYEGIDVASAAPHRGPEGIRQSLAQYFQAFPDLEFTEEQTIVDTSHIVQVWTASGTHRGTLMNIPPTGRKIKVHGVSVLTLEGDKIRHGYYVWDVAGLLRSIGLLPEL